LLKFLFYNDGVIAQDFPPIFRTDCPRELFEDYLVEQRDFISEENGIYKLTPAGTNLYKSETIRIDKRNDLLNKPLINIDNSIKAGRDISGIVIKDSQLRDFEPRPIINPENHTNPIIPTKAKYPLLKWIVKHIWYIISGVIIVLLSSYIVYHYHLFK